METEERHRRVATAWSRGGDRVRRRSELIQLSRVLAGQQGILDQPADAAVPGVVRTHPKVRLLVEDHGAVARVADLNAHGIFGSADALDDSGQGLIRAECQGDAGIAAARAGSAADLSSLIAWRTSARCEVGARCTVASSA